MLTLLKRADTVENTNQATQVRDRKTGIAASTVLPRCLVWLGIVGSCAVGAWLILPSLVGAYRLEAGGRALVKALGGTDLMEWWYIGPRTVQDPQALLEAIAHLQKADSQPHAWRLLGRAWVAQGDVLRGVDALERAIVFRPLDPVGRLELAAAYELVDRQLQEAKYVDLLEILQGAVISTPGTEGGTAYRPEGWENEYAYPTAFSLPPEYGERPTLFLHAGSRVTYTVELTQPAVLRFGMALDPRSLDWGGDGATFEVFVDGKRVFLEHLEVEVAREGWQEREVDLAEHVGRTVRLTLATTPGPVGDVTADWAGWGEPRIEAPEAAAYRQVAKGRPWLSEWQGSSVWAEDFIAAGEVARKAKRYSEAMDWYRRAMRLEPGLGDPGYYVGLLYEDQGQWRQALDAYQGAIGSVRFDQVHRSSLYYRIGIIYQWRLDPPRLEGALEAYEGALRADDFSADWEEADCHYKRGEILRQKNGSPDEYVMEFRKAVELNPRQVWPHILLGLAVYEQDQDVTTAESELLRAIALAPRNRDAHYHLGEIYRQENRIREALEMYEKALEIDPGFEAARKRLATLSDRYR